MAQVVIDAVTAVDTSTIAISARVDGVVTTRMVPASLSAAEAQLQLVQQKQSEDKRRTLLGALQALIGVVATV